MTEISKYIIMKNIQGQKGRLKIYWQKDRMTKQTYFFNLNNLTTMTKLQ